MKRRPNGYRTSPPEAMLVLELIVTEQKADFSLDEIRTLVPPDLEQWEHGELIEALRRKVADNQRVSAVLVEQSKHRISSSFGWLEC